MGARWATNGTTRPHTTPDNPYLEEYRIHDSTRMSRSTSAGATLDYRISNNDRISLSFQYTFLGVTHNNRRLDFLGNAVDPGNFSPTYTHGRTGAGEVRISSQTGRDWLGTTVVSSLAYRHNGPLWKAEAGTGFSHQALHIRDIDKGWFNAVQARRTGVTIDFDDNYYLQPGRITVKDTAGNPVDFYNLDNYSLASANSDPRDNIDAKQSAYANLRRDLMVRSLPVSLKGGLEIRRAMRDTDGPGAATYNYRGLDNRASTNPVGNDDAAGIVLDESFTQRIAPFGFGHVPWISNQKYWELYKAHPEQFAPIDENARYRSGVAGSKFAEEVVSAAYLRGDIAFFERRLKFVGGVRGEQTNVKAEGPLSDPTRNYQRDARGNIVDGNPNQAGIQPVLLIPTSNALGVSQLTYIERGQRAEKEYLRWFPSINASYDIRENLIFRAAYYYSVGRPDFNQYAGGITLPDLALQPNISNGARIQVNNAGIKAWSARSTKVRLEYYFASGGQVSIGAFRRDFYNLFQSTTFTSTPEFLAHYGLDPDIYGQYEVVTQSNITNGVRMTGLEFAYKQSLTFLPHWARGITVFTNVSAQRAIDDPTNGLSSYIPRTYSWGMTLTRPKFSVHVNWNYRSRYRAAQLYPGQSQATTSIEPGTYQWGSKRLYVDLSCDYNLTKRVGLFASFRNLTGEVQDVQAYGPSTPKIARLESRGDYGGIWSFGLKGRF
jgi:TonB-dependent receptor